MMVAKTVSVRFPLQYKYEYLGTENIDFEKYNFHCKMLISSIKIQVILTVDLRKGASETFVRRSF